MVQLVTNGFHCQEQLEDPTKVRFFAQVPRVVPRFLEWNGMGSTVSRCLGMASGHQGES